MINHRANNYGVKIKQLHLEYLFEMNIPVVNDFGFLFPIKTIYIFN